MLGLHILLGDEFLYLVYLKRCIDGAAGACILAVLAADAAADCREGVILLDELESIGVAAVGCHLDVALNCDVSRACNLAGCGAGGPGLDRSVFVFVIFVPVILAPLGLVGKLVMRILDGPSLRRASGRGGRRRPGRSQLTCRRRRTSRGRSLRCMRKRKGWGY